MRDGFGNPLSPEQEADIRARNSGQADGDGPFSPSPVPPNSGGRTGADAVAVADTRDVTPVCYRDLDPAGRE